MMSVCVNIHKFLRTCQVPCRLGTGMAIQCDTCHGRSLPGDDLGVEKGLQSEWEAFKDLKREELAEPGFARLARDS